MTKRDAARLASRWLAANYNVIRQPEDLNLIPDGPGSWSFKAPLDDEREDTEGALELTGYVHADGTIEGLY